MQERSVFFVSDQTGITIEAVGRSLISQFDQVHFIGNRAPYIDTDEKVQTICQQIQQAYDESQTAPLVFSSIIDAQHRQMIAESPCVFMDIFADYLVRLEQEFGCPGIGKTGRLHGMFDSTKYMSRIEAVDFVLGHDDGLNTHNYNAADLILLGVSRSGKTPTCLYLAMQFGLRAANYPFTEDDERYLSLNEDLKKCRDKCFGLVIDPQRLHEIRSERRPNSTYASMAQCRQEINRLLVLYEHEKIPYLNSTNFSIEEIATQILARKGMAQRFE